MKSKKLPRVEDQGDCPNHEATQDEDKVKCDALTPLVLIEEGEKEGQPLLYEVNCEDNKAKVEELIGKVRLHCFPIRSTFGSHMLDLRSESLARTDSTELQICFWPST